MGDAVGGPGEGAEQSGRAARSHYVKTAGY